MENWKRFHYTKNDKINVINQQNEWKTTVIIRNWFRHFLKKCGITRMITQAFFSEKVKCLKEYKLQTKISVSMHKQKNISEHCFSAHMTVNVSPVMFEDNLFENPNLFKKMFIKIIKKYRLSRARAFRGGGKFCNNIFHNAIPCRCFIHAKYHHNIHPKVNFTKIIMNINTLKWSSTMKKCRVHTLNSVNM